MKLTLLKYGVLSAILGPLGYLAYHNSPAPATDGPAFVANAMYRVRNPDPGTIFRADYDKFLIANAQMNAIVAQAGGSINGSVKITDTEKRSVELAMRRLYHSRLVRLY